jgi:hypothetical protein
MNVSYLKAWEIQPGIHPQVIHPPVEKLKTPGGIGTLSEYPHTHMGVHSCTRGHLYKGEEEILNLINTGSFFNGMLFT